MRHAERDRAHHKNHVETNDYMIMLCCIGDQKKEKKKRKKVLMLCCIGDQQKKQEKQCFRYQDLNLDDYAQSILLCYSGLLTLTAQTKIIYNGESL